MTPSPPNRHLACKNRIVIDEILDALPSDHPHAIASRKDLYRINQLMGNYRFLKQELGRHLRPKDHCVEIGSGSGQLSQTFSLRSPANTIPPVTGIDLAPRPPIWPEQWPWYQENIFDSEIIRDADIIMASLILHHFKDEELKVLGEQLTTHARVLLITEPLRHTFSHTLGRLAEWSGIHPVTRHDMHVSIDAGFRKGELPELLGIQSDEWTITEQVDWRGSLRMVAYLK